jgi:uncharacterized membrane protein
MKGGKAAAGREQARAARQAAAQAAVAAQAPPEPSSGGTFLTRLLAPSPPDEPPPPTWLQWTTWLLSLAALGVSIYLTIEHFTTNSLAGCPENSTFNCLKVTTSSESIVFGVLPVAVLGLAFYVFMTAINTPWAWRSGIAAIWWARLAGIITGIGFVLYLIYAEVIQIGNLCLDCTTVHVITFLLFVVLVYAATMRPTPDSAR